MEVGLDIFREKKDKSVELDEQQMELIREIVKKLNDILGSDDYIKNIRIIVNAESVDNYKYTAIFYINDTVEDND